MSTKFAASALTFKEIEELAEQFAKDLQFNPQEHDIRTLVKKLNGTIEVDRTIKPLKTTSKFTSLTCFKDGKFIIFVPSWTGMLRDNFTIAHELGHLLLHVKPYLQNNPAKLQVSMKRFDDKILEQQANRFAAGLLMPRKEFLELGKYHNWDTFHLTVAFLVTNEVIKYWKDNLLKELPAD